MSLQMSFTTLDPNKEIAMQENHGGPEGLQYYPPTNRVYWADPGADSTSLKKLCSFPINQTSETKFTCYHTTDGILNV